MANFEKTISGEVVRRAAKLIARSGRTVLSEPKTAGLAGLKCRCFHDIATLAKESDLLLVFGGDGTMLGVLREADESRTPVLGINIGRLGFLTAVSSRDLPAALRKVWSNDFTIDAHPFIEASGKCQGKSLRMTALNDIVISHGAVSRMIELDVTVNGDFLTRYRGDGLVISSPAGSTAYSLSAGGPIISPGAEVFAITPICAHALTNRSVVVGSDSIIKVTLVTKNIETIAAADGQVLASLSPGDVLTIRRSRRIANLMHLGGTCFYETIRHKLHWSGSSV